MFDNIAGKYDLLNRVLSLGMDQRWRRHMIKRVLEDSPSTLVDVATGTADVAIQLAQKSPNLSIVGIDLSEEMLKKGQVKIDQKGLNERIQLQQGDSEHLNLSSNSCDAITVAFGVRNFENLQAGLKEMHRVLKTNGKVWVLEFSRPRIFPFKQLFNGYFKYVLPKIGQSGSNDPRAYDYLYESVQAFPDGADFVAEMEQAGFKKNSVNRLTLGICSLYCGVK